MAEEVSSLRSYNLTQVWDHGKQAASSVYDAGSKALVALVAGIALSSVASSFAAVCLGVGVGIFASKLVVNLLNRYNNNALTQTKRNLIHFVENHRIICVISLVFVVVIGTQAPALGFTLATSAGGALGLIIDDLKVKKLIKIHRSEQSAIIV